MRDTGSRFVPTLGVLALILAAALGSGGLGVSATAGHTTSDLGQLLRQAHVGHPETVMEHLRGYEDSFYAQRSAPGTTIPAGAYAAAVAQAKLRGNVPSGAWFNLGPQPINSEDPTYTDPVANNFGAGWGIDSGRTTAVAVHPTNESIAYIGTADGGVWKTTNGGLTWFITSEGLPSQAIGSIALATAAPNTLYVGTGEPVTAQDTYYGAGVFKTTNGGVSWAKVGGSVFDRTSVFKILTRDYGKTLLVATNQGLYRSTNGGGSFALVLQPGDPNLFQSFISDIELAGSNRVLAVVGWREGSPTNGIYSSGDDGASWTRFKPTGYPPIERLGRATLAVLNSAPNTVYAVIEDAGYFNVGNGWDGTVLNGVYKSSNGVDGPWRKIADAQELAADPGSAMDPAKIGTGFAPGIQAWYDQHIEIDPTNPNRLILGLEELYQSLDGGEDWDTIGRYWNYCSAKPPWPASPWCNSGPGTANHPKTTHPDQHDGRFTASGNYYAANDGGIWFQSGPVFDNDHWSSLNATISTGQCFYGDISNDGTALCGMQDNGTGLYNGSKRWPLVTGGDGGDVALEPYNSAHQWAEYVGLTVRVSADGGRTWRVIAPPDPFPRFISPFEMDPKDPNHVIAGGELVWETHAGVATTTWNSLYDVGGGHQSTAVSVNGGYMYSAWCGPCNPSQFTPGTPFQRGLATNVGGYWHQVAVKGVPNRYITSVTQDPANAAHVYITLSAFARRWIPDAGIGHVFESWDAGERFTDISGDLPDAPANDTILLGDRLIVATDVGVFQQQPDGSYRVLGSGLPTASALDLAVQPGTSNIIVATHGRGVWKLIL